jgi:hypothetical protein
MCSEEEEEFAMATKLLKEAVHDRMHYTRDVFCVPFL